MQKAGQVDAKGHKAVNSMCQDDEDKEVSAQESDVVISKVFKFHSVTSVIIAKLKTKAAKK